LDRLAKDGATIAYHDPFVPSLALAGRKLRSKTLSPILLSRQDAVVVLTAHSTVDFANVVRHSPLVVDTRGVTRGRRSNVVRL
jgi:UDP-N-acetyl-D-glucosamine dehydrogenase